MKEDDFNQVFLRLDEIRSSKKTVTAKIALHKRMANGTIKEKAFTFRRNQGPLPRLDGAKTGSGAGGLLRPKEAARRER